MAGWVGIIDAGASPPTRGDVERLAAVMVRGAPDVESWADGAAAIAWRRDDGEVSPVAITDDVVAILDGEIAPISEDPHRPSALGHDPMRLVEAWRRWGVDLVERVEGDFTAVIWERRSGVLHLLRDRTGIKALFFARRPRAIVFSAELPPLLDVPWVSRELARDHLAEYLAFRVVHAPRTLARDVSQLEPGWRLRVAGDEVRATRYHQPRYAAPGTPVPRESDVVPELNAAIQRAVKRALSGGVETGVYLSGGVGSTAVVAAARAASRSLKTFTVALADEASPESPFAGRVARLFGMEHQTITVSSKDLADHFDEAVTALGHPNGNAVIVLQLVLARAARMKVPRVLTGDGADQLFGGRMLDAPAEALRRVQRFHRLPAVLRTLLKVPLERSDRLRDLLIPPERYLLERGFGGVELCDPAQRRSLLLDGLFVRSGVRQEVLGPLYGEVHTDELNAVMHAFLRSQLGADVLPRVVSTAESVGLSVGFPLLDREVQRLAMLLPGGFKVRGLGGSLPTRWLLRAMLQGSLPPALINRPDRPMPRPLDDWLSGPGRLFLEERFSHLRRDPLGLWHHTGLEAMKRGLGRSPGAAHRLWGLFILDAWARRVKVG